MKNGVRDTEERLELEFVHINRLADHGRLDEAQKYCEALHHRHPEHPRVIHALGLLNYRIGNLDEGEALIRRALQMKPDYVDAHYNLGRILHLSMRNDEAETVFRAGLALAPDDPKQLYSLASILVHQRCYREALDICQKELEINPSLPEVYGEIGNIKLALGEADAALDFFRKELKLSSNHATHSCILFVLNLISGVTQSDIYQESLEWEKRHILRSRKQARGHYNLPDPNRRLRVGYVSGDFRKHPVGYHIHLLLASYDKRKTEVFLYDTCPLKEEMTQELADLADHYRSIALMSDDKAEMVIRRDGIDILVDLAGHTGMHRLMLFARRPAPVQATWIGYFNTTGLKAMDYFIGDPITTPPEEDSFFSETVIRLPDNRFCYQAQTYTPEVSLTPVLKKGYITFGSFNGIHKISNAVIELWSRVMTAVPGSRFVLKQIFVDDALMERIYLQFKLCGISSDRLEIRGQSPHSEMLAEYGDIDISLDTFPFNGGITTCESLWMGVPVITLAGSSPIGRQSKAYLHAIGHPEWVAASSEEYVAIAINLSANVALLNKIRQGLRGEMATSPLCDGKRFAANLENVYRTMWRRWCADETKRLDVTPDITRRFTADELFDAGVNCLNDGDYDRAGQLLRRFIRRRPGHAPAYNNLAVVMKKMGRIHDSISCFRHAIRNDPLNIDLYLNLGLTFQTVGAYSKARDVFRRACQIEPGNSKVWNALGTAFRFMGRLKEARSAYERTLEIDPQNVDALGLLAVIWGMYGDHHRSLELLKFALAIEPFNKFLISVAMSYSMYQEGTRQEVLYLMSKQYERALQIRGDAITKKYPMPDKAHLRIGFLSPDFKAHPVGMLLSSFFRCFDRSRLSLVCFNTSITRPDHLTEWYRSVATEWHDVAGMEDENIVDYIENQQIDVLVDLSGHTNSNTNGLPVLYHRAAPVQAAWLGFGHTTGLSGIDYVIADNEFIRPEDRQWFCEKPIYLSSNRFCFTPPSPSPEVVEPPCVENDYITFGSFNNLVKLNEQVIELWARILKQVPKSRLVLKYKSLNEYDVRKFTLERFKGHGLPSGRIELRPSSNLYFMLLEYGDVDITLDPFPFTGGMTSLFSLWMGVPVMSLSGELPISRQTKSFLDLVGLDDLVAHTREEYVTKTVALANDPNRLISIREKLRQNMLESPLCDATKYSLALGDLFFKMWNEKKIYGHSRVVIDEGNT